MVSAAEEIKVRETSVLKALIKPAGAVAGGMRKTGGGREAGMDKRGMLMWAGG